MTGHSSRLKQRPASGDEGGRGVHREGIVRGVDATQDALASLKPGDLKVAVFQDEAETGNARSTRRSPRASRSTRRPAFPFSS
jgi:hypothetical protein